jgi:hypothetical protein
MTCSVRSLLTPSHHSTDCVRGKSRKTRKHPPPLAPLMGRSDILRGLHRRSKCAPFSRLLLFLDCSGQNHSQHLPSSTAQGRGARSSTQVWVISIGTASTGQYNNASRTCSPVIGGFAIRTRALSRIIPRPITASVTLARIKTGSKRTMRRSLS